MARLITIIVLFVVLGCATALRHKVVQHRRVLAENATSVCAYDENGGYGVWTANCGFNPVWLSQQTGVAPFAKADIIGAKWLLECAKHNVSSGTAAAFAACAADSANYCLVDGEPGAYGCYTRGLTAAAVLVKAFCPGSAYEALQICASTSVENCTGACMWRPDLGAQNYTDYKLNRAAVGAGYQKYQYCYPSSYNATWKTKSDFERTMNNLSPADPVEYAKVRGTCDYAKNGRRRFEYDNSCRKPFQTDVEGLMLGSIDPVTDEATYTGVDATLATQCLVAGCNLYYIPSWVAWGYGQDYFQCDTSPPYRYSLGYYDPKDTVLLAAVRACSDPAVRYNKERCITAVL